MKRDSFEAYFARRRTYWRRKLGGEITVGQHWQLFLYCQAKWDKSGT